MLKNEAGGALTSYFYEAHTEMESTARDIEGVKFLENEDHLQVSNVVVTD